MPGSNHADRAVHSYRAMTPKSGGEFLQPPAVRHLLVEREQPHRVLGRDTRAVPEDSPLLAPYRFDRGERHLEVALLAQRGYKRGQLHDRPNGQLELCNEREARRLIAPTGSALPTKLAKKIGFVFESTNDAAHEHSLLRWRPSWPRCALELSCVDSSEPQYALPATTRKFFSGTSLELTLTSSLLAIAAGALAGIINTVAGSGSLVTLSLLIFLGLPPHLANGTNRLGISLQSLVGLLTLKRHGALDLRGAGWYVLPVLAGAAAGALVAADIAEQTLNLAILLVMVVMLVLLFINPNRWIKSTGDQPIVRPPWLVLLAFVGIGFYGGFIQAGVGMLLLAGLVIGGGIDPMRANTIKLGLNFVFTTAALLIFAAKGQVLWGVGAVVAIGQVAGAYVAARFLARSERAGVWIHRVLIAVVALTVAKFLYDLAV